MLFTSTIFQHLGHEFSVLFSSVETVALTRTYIMDAYGH